MEQTVFDKIVNGEIPCNKIYEDNYCIAFLDLHPVNIGHALVIPKKHSRNIFDTEDIIVEHLFRVAKKIAISLQKVVGAEGVNIIMNNEPAAGQEIFYCHIHIIPRYINDGFVHWHGKNDYAEGEKDLVTEKIKNVLK